jgi:hypothetical protein
MTFILFARHVLDDVHAAHLKHYVEGTVVGSRKGYFKFFKDAFTTMITFYPLELSLTIFFKQGN